MVGDQLVVGGGLQNRRQKSSILLLTSIGSQHEGRAAAP